MNFANRSAASGNLGTADVLTGSADFRQGAKVIGGNVCQSCLVYLVC